jgi:hypothetical protein
MNEKLEEQRANEQLLEDALKEALGIGPRRPVRRPKGKTKTYIATFESTLDLTDPKFGVLGSEFESEDGVQATVIEVAEVSATGNKVKLTNLDDLAEFEAAGKE